MIPNKNINIIVISTLFIILLTYFLYNPINNDLIIKNFINGYWTSNKEFAKLSKIDDMILNIDINDASGFLIIIIDKEINSNDEFFIDIDNFKYHDGVYKFNMELISDDENFIWNEKKFKCIMSINDGSLKLFNENILYADLYKDNNMTNLLK